MCKFSYIKGMGPKNEILSSFTHSRVISNLQNTSENILKNVGDQNQFLQMSRSSTEET